MGKISKTAAELDVLTGAADGKIQLDILTSKPAWSSGQLWQDTASIGPTIDMAISDVRASIAQEMYTPVYNNTGGPIADGTPIAGSGSYVGGIPSVVEADADNFEHILGFLGVVTAEIADGAVGLATYFGAVQGVDTSLLSVAPAYLASGGGLTNTLPLYPTGRFLIGGVTVSDASNGVIGVAPVRIPRPIASKSYNFSSNGIGAGTYWKGGFYDWSTVDANLTQASASVTYGANVSKAAHVGIVPSAAGVVVGGGQVGVRVTGTQDSESGVQIAAQTAIITSDITTLTANVMAECSEKFSGNVLIELYVVTGTPTSYSLDFNYGYSKYEDFSNSDFTVTGFDCEWQGGATDASPDIALYHHKPIGWTYAATGFTPGNSEICRKSVDQAITGGTLNNEDSAYKRVSLDTFVHGDTDEGILVQIITNANGTFQTLDIHVTGVSEEIA